jgi:protoporphyrinogen oxidase
VTVLEASGEMGGISRTVERSGWRFDIGGHRFFTKVPEVAALWTRLLGDEDFPVRSRLSRILYDGKFYDYPLNARNALGNLGIRRATRCMASFAWARIRPPRDRSTFEGWVVARFGRELYRTFFQTYTEKVWGVPGSSIQAEWAAQRIRSLSLGRAVRSALTGGRAGAGVTSLIEQFRYPRLGPGMMWDSCAARVVGAGGTIVRDAEVVALHREGRRVCEVSTRSGDHVRRHGCDAVISSMPLGELVLAMRPAAPADVVEAARALRHRDFLTVALVVPDDAAFADNWIYVHAPDVRVGRIQNFGAWSPDMVRPGTTCLGLEYFVQVGDDLWSASDDELVELASAEVARLGLVDRHSVQHGFVVRMAKAYPVYDADYHGNVDTVRRWLEEHAVNVQPIGRNGMHRYNNQDHSMLTAMLAVENLLDGAAHDLWSVNVDDSYHEESVGGASGTGRAAPVVAA